MYISRKKEYLKFDEVKVYGLYTAIKASGIPMLKEFNGEFDEVVEKDFKRASHLGTCGTGEGHDSFLKGITVQFNVEYPVYWSPQFQRYHFAEIVSSQSTMHKITKMNIDDICDEYTSNNTRRYLKKLVDLYNKALIEFGSDEKFTMMIDPESNEIVNITKVDDELWYIGARHKKQIGTTKDLYHYIIVNLPQGQNKWMRVSTNYLQLKTMYLQRQYHKLYAWEDFCKFCLSLPRFEELCLNKK